MQRATGDLALVDACFDGDLQGANTIDGLHLVSQVAASPDGGPVYASGGLEFSTDLDRIAIFSRNAASGALTWMGSIISPSAYPTISFSTRPA